MTMLNYFLPALYLDELRETNANLTRLMNRLRNAHLAIYWPTKVPPKINAH